MKKNILITTLSFLFMFNVSFFAAEIEPYVSGDWYSSIYTNYDGISEVGSTNNTSTNQSIYLEVLDVTSDEEQYSDDFVVSTGQMAKSGVVYTRINHQMQGLVFTPASNHSPWFNA